MKKTMYGIILFLLSTSAYSWNSADLTISHIDVKSGGNASVFFTIASDTPNPANCSQVDTVSWEGTNPSASNFLSTMLAAHMSGKKVQLQVDTDVCLWGGWPRLLTVRVK